MSSLYTPQKYLTKSSLPPKPSTPKTGQKPTISFENIQNTPVSSSPRNSTPVKQKQIDFSKTPLKSNNSSPSHRRSIDVITNCHSDETKKFHEHILKIESEKDKLKQDLESQQNTISELEQKNSDFAAKLKKKDGKIRFLALLLKETETQFKIVLENTSKDLEKIIQEQALKIKELNEALKTQQKELNAKWETEKTELAEQINLLELVNVERMKTQAQSFTEKINELSLSIEKLEKTSVKKENDLEFYLKASDDSENFKVICGLGGKVKNEIKHLKEIVESIAKDQDVGLSMILMTPNTEENIGISDLPKVLQNSLLNLHVIRTCVSDLYAEKFGQICKIQ